MLAETKPIKMKKLKKYLEKIYWSNEQKLYYTTDSKITEDGCMYDISLLHKGIGYRYGEYLFSIYNIESYADYYCQPHQLKVESQIDFNKVIYETDEYTYRPYYFDRDFFIPKISCITKEDIEKAMEYFTLNVMDMWFYNKELIEEGDL